MLVEYFGGFRLAGEEAGEGSEVVDGFHFFDSFLYLSVFLTDVFIIS